MISTKAVGIVVGNYYVVTYLVVLYGYFVLVVF